MERKARILPLKVNIDNLLRIAALFVGPLRMTPEEAIEELGMVAHAVFLNTSSELTTPKTNMSNLRRALEDMLDRRGLPTNIKLNAEHLVTAKCKV
jgi:hypothetical protein